MRHRCVACESEKGKENFYSWRKEDLVVPVAEMMLLAAAGWAFLVWLCGGGVGLAVVVFIVLKLLGK
jgi:hypothetical protein